VSADIDATAQCWATAYRVGVKIAALPAAGEQLDRIVDLQMWAIRQIVAGTRETAFDGTERCLRAAGGELGVAVANQRSAGPSCRRRLSGQLVSRFDDATTSRWKSSPLRDARHDVGQSGVAPI
jgi:hypothetical protein